MVKNKELKNKNFKYFFVSIPKRNFEKWNQKVKMASVGRRCASSNYSVKMGGFTRYIMIFYGCIDDIEEAILGF